jgi:hypothetical protein
LVKGVLESVFEKVWFLEGECGGDTAGVGAALDGGEAVERGGENFSGFGCGDFEGGDEEDEGEVVRDGESGDATARGDGESAEGCGCGVIGVAFEGGADAEEVVDGQGRIR